MKKEDILALCRVFQYMMYKGLPNTRALDHTAEPLEEDVINLIITGVSAHELLNHIYFRDDK